MWTAFIGMLRAVIFAVARACGGSVGGSIAVVTFVLQLALIPLSLRVMRRARENAAQHGVRMLDSLMLVSAAIQLPLFGGLCALNTLVRAGLGLGRRFLWIADLGRPDGWIALAAAALVGASVLLAPAGSAPNAATTAATRFAALAQHDPDRATLPLAPSHASPIH